MTFKKGCIPWNKDKKGIYSKHSLKLNRDKHLGKNNHNWKGGLWKTSEGYVVKKDSSHPFCDKRGYVMYHRLIMEKHIKRYLKKNEIVHHINNIKDDNRIKNLKICSKKEHRMMHVKKRIKNNKYKCSRCKRYKPYDNFVKSKTKRYGITTDCKLCRRKLSKIYHAKHRVVQFG